MPIEARLALLLGVVERGDGARLRQSVALEHLAAELLFEALEDLDGKGRAARAAHAQARRVLDLVVRQVEQGDVHRRHALEDRHVVALEDLHRLGRLEARDQRQARALVDAGVEPAGLAEGVEQRERAEDHVVLGDLGERVGRDLAVGLEVRVRELGALGRAGRTARVEDHGGVVGVDVRDLAERLGLGQQLLERAGLDGDQLGAGLLGAGGGGLLEVAPAEHDLGARVLQVERDLAALEQHVHRDDDAARTQHAVVGEREVRDVREHDPDPVALLHPLGLEQPGDPRAALVEGVVVDDDVVELQGGPVAEPVRAPVSA